MIAIHSRPAMVVAVVLVERAATSGSPKLPTKVNEYEPAICARFAITMTSATMIPQPPIQPVIGPNALVAHVKVVPQSARPRTRC